MRKETNMKRKRNFRIYTMIISIIILLSIGIVYYAVTKPNDSQVDMSEISGVNNQLDENNILETNNIEEASVVIGKSVEESENELKQNTTEEEKIAINTSMIDTEKVEETKATTKKTNEKITEEQTQEIVEEKKELVFSMPVDGEIIKEFAKDTLLYSATLNEWTTHLGIDIKAEKTTVVKASECGVVKYIKNDPRYGLTIVIEHDDGFKTVYSNLLTSEFVVEGETVEKGQTIGTVGNTAVFEIADESHLHFEILKDNVQVDPNIYIK